jgi:hypothetical protein
MEYSKVKSIGTQHEKGVKGAYLLMTFLVAISMSSAFTVFLPACIA